MCRRKVVTWKWNSRNKSWKDKRETQNYILIDKEERNFTKKQVFNRAKCFWARRDVKNLLGNQEFLPELSLSSGRKAGLGGAEQRTSSEEEDMASDT